MKIKKKELFRIIWETGLLQGYSLHDITTILNWICIPILIIGFIALLIVAGLYGGLIFILCVIPMYLVVIGLVYLCLILFGFKKIKNVIQQHEDALIQREKIKYQEKTKKEEKKKGDWKFPNLKFYDRCLEIGAINLENKYQLQKAITLAEEILTQNKVPKSAFGFYISEEKVKEYYRTAEIEKQHQAEIEKNKKEKEYITPYDSVLTDEERKKISFYESLKTVETYKKRELMLKAIIDDLKKKYDEADMQYRSLMNSSKTANELAMQPTPQKDWAILGGIAQGIAGPIAGISVASQTIAENEKAKAVAAENRKTYAQASISFSMRASDYKDEARAYKSDINRRQKEFSKIRYKTVFDEVDTNELFDTLNIKPTIKTTKDKFSFILKLKTNYKTNLEPSMKKVIDGTIQAKVFCDDILVDSVCVPLPMYGLSLTEQCSTDLVYSRKRMKGKNRNYRIEFEPNSLWLMEE